MKDKNSKKKPFFASFLEKQLKDPETVKGGGVITIPERDVITKPVVDNVTSPQDDLMVTMKYPSDGDDDSPSVPVD
ncbi:microviridin/marinostatin family tricyclic proteinase inhibitor [Chryseobacterium antibioticum]|uniref:Microviridin/marinostatin family tricyclic proteinase inhibitor n=2 Tax=Chryseobacterium TaxID=59732 RepID=A0A7Y0AQJ5_9FLAO|nr:MULTISPECIES: microviridin/marinostatin family tricyclic proteinase inhibitor [Chryseobacterium]MCT2405972.1 microviridin/marinostatin family tricyclic proteinase inhibitor [Chryseobacterium pyrolae]NML71632.1 microviridin/marinostatin family tricyclic proteinase inhibitor [Chryseobacterium antibioticum]